MKILLVYPEFIPTLWSFKYALPYIGKRASMPPLGLATVAAMLPKEHFEVSKIVDMNVEPLRDEQISQSDIVFVSSMIAQQESTAKVIERAHKLGKKVVAGGPYPTSYSDKVGADYIVAGEAEITLKPFLKDLFRSRAKRFYDEETCLKRQHSLPISQNGKPSLTLTPTPRWDLLDLKNYASLAIQFSRGCPHDCEFCDITKLFGRVPRTKTPEQMISELNAIYENGWRGPVFIVDDNFIGNKKEVRRLLPIVANWQRERGYPFSFFTEADMNLGSPENQDILDGFNKAGFDSVFVGVESPNPKTLEGMHKIQNLGGISLKDRIEVMQRSGLEVTAGFIVGNDEDGQDVFENIFNFVQNTGIVIPMVGLLTAVRGTRLYSRLEREGRLREGPLSGSHTHDFNFNFTPKLDEKFLIEGYANLLKELFKPENYFKRCETLEQRRGKYHKSKLVNNDGFYALGRIIYQNSIVKPDSQFFKYALGILFRKPSSFPESISHAVKFHHFRTMTEGASSVLDYRMEATRLYENFCERASELKDSAGKHIHEIRDKIRRIENEIMRRATKRYNALHKDFRRNADDALRNLRETIREHKAQYLAGLQGA